MKKLSVFFFTLFELITVVSISLILLAMIFPMFSKARSGAKRTHCMSNLRKIGTQATVYQFNHSTVMPASFGNTTDNQVNHWINYLIKQGVDYTVFQCPSMSEDMMFDPAGHDPQTGNIYTKASYIMNIIGLNRWSGADLDSPKEKSCGWGISSTKPVKISQVAYPSETIYITDVIGGIANSHSGINDFRRTDLGITATGRIVGQVRWVGNHHSGGFNALFGDGHIEFIDKSTANQWVAVPDF